jgi:HEAT repeat protein
MARTFFVIVVAVCLAFAACSRHEAVPELSQETVNPQPAAPAAAAPVAKAVNASIATSAAPATNVGAAPSSRVRDLIAGYLVSDGRGGWHKNEKAATELETLTSEETSQIWPMTKDPQANVRRGAAVFLLGQFDEADSQQVEAFTALLSDADAFVRARGLDAARQFVATDKILALPKVTALLAATHEDRAENRAAAVRLCGGMKKGAREVLPAIEKAAVADPDAKVRAAAATAAVQIAEPQEAVAVLKNVLTDKDPSVRLAAAARLRQLARDAAPAAKELSAALADSDKDVAEAAAEALIRMGSPAIEPLAEQLSGSSLAARKLALACLAKLGPVAKSAVPRVAKCKQDADAEVRQLAEVAIRSIGSP